MEQAALKEWQKKAIAVISKEKNLIGFYLSGGTALSAYYLRHRASDDLDFFSLEKPDSVFLHSFSSRLSDGIGTKDVRYNRLHDRYQFFFQNADEEWKVEFVHYPFACLEPRKEIDGINIDSERDIAANKLTALIDRFDPKDFVDMYFLLQKRDLSDIRADTEKKFGVEIDDIFLGGELAKVRRIEALPKMFAPLSLLDLKKFFEDQIKKSALSIIG